MAKGSSLTVDEPPHPDLPYVDLDELRSADGVIGIISQHRANGILTFTILREFEQFGRHKRTGFFPENMVESYQAMVGLVLERLKELQATMPALEDRDQRRSPRQLPPVRK